MNVVNSLVCDCEAKINKFLLLFIPSDAWYNQGNLLPGGCVEEFIVDQVSQPMFISPDVMKAVSVPASFTAVGVL